MKIVRYQGLVVGRSQLNVKPCVRSVREVEQNFLVRATK